MSLAHSILTLLLITLGTVLLCSSLWIVITFSNNILMAFFLATSALASIYSGWILRKPTSPKKFILKFVSTGLISTGIGLVVISLWLQILNQFNAALIYGLIGLTTSVFGWLLRKSKLNLIRNIISALLITTGISIFILPVIILAVYGTNVAFANIALTYFIFGILLGLIGLSVRQKKS